MKNIIILLLFGTSLFAQEVDNQKKSSLLFSSPHGSWQVKTLGYLDFGATYFSSDLGSHTNFTGGVGGMLYNVSDKNANVVVSYRALYQNFGAKDDYSRVTRDFLGIGGGIGIHLDEMVYGTLNLTHYWVLRPESGEGPLSTMAATMKGMIVVARYSAWQILLGLEGGMSIEDMDFRDGPLTGDRHDRTWLLRFSFSMARNF